MSGSTISTTIENQLTLGGGIYLSPLTISNTGQVSNPHGGNRYSQFVPTIWVPASDSNATIVNEGTILAPDTNPYSVDIMAEHSTLNGQRLGCERNAEHAILANGRGRPVAAKPAKRSRVAHRPVYWTRVKSCLAFDWRIHQRAKLDFMACLVPISMRSRLLSTAVTC